MPIDPLTQANDFFNQGNFTTAKSLYEKILFNDPDNYGALNGRGMILTREGNLHKAISDFRKVIALHPNPATFSNLGKLYTKFKLWDEAQNAFDQAITLDKHFVAAYCNYGRMYIQKADTQKAIEYFEKVIRINPHYQESYIELASSHMILGNKDKARTYYKKLLEIDPNNVLAYHDLSSFQQLTDEEIQRCESLLTVLQNQHESCDIHFALGAAYGKLKDFDQSFKHYQNGNKILSTIRPFNKDNFSRYIDSIISTYSENFFKHHSFPCESTKQPIFIIGLPRTGSTLIEQILTSHSMVYGVGELGFFDSCSSQLPQILKTNKHYPECTTHITKNLANKLVKEYYRQSGDNNFRYIVDKSLTNFQHLGLIAMLFPKAKIINCTRSPLDMATSMYCIRFTNGNAFSNSFEDISCYYKNYQKLIEHWNKVLPLPIYNIHYDDFIEYKDDIIEEMFDYIGIKIEERCFNYHKNDRAVRTASVMQVRQPVYKSSVERWRKYEKYIAKYQILFD